MRRRGAVTGWLRVDCGQQARTGRWVRYPAADYACFCGFTDSASGDAVPGFTATVRRVHAASGCRLRC